MLAFLRQRWFLVALLAVLAAGMIWPATFSPITKAIPRNLLVASVMFLMALPIESGVIWQSIRRPGPAWLGFAINAGLAPILGWLASHALTGDLAIGLIVVTAVPCTLAGATVWTRRAGGNDAVAILVTMISSLACFLVAPAWLKLLVGAEVEINYVDLLWELMLLVAAPIAVAQLLRLWRPLGAAASRHKVVLSELAQIGILLMVLVGAVGCGEQIQNLSDREELSAYNISVMVLTVAAIHLTLLAFGMAAAHGLGMSRPDGIAVGIAGSQKTIMAGLFVALQFGPLAILPMVAYHTVQMLLDTLVADWLREGPQSNQALPRKSTWDSMMDSHLGDDKQGPNRPGAMRGSRVMKDGIHPEYYETKVTCGCGNKFSTRSTRKELRVDICNVCHPFYTGKLKFVDAAGRIEKFKSKFAAGYASLKRGKK